MEVYNQNMDGKGLFALFLLLRLLGCLEPHCEWVQELHFQWN
ncbi:hypothetical protein [Paenibacillus lautus]|nr:hypothetical protein [Paenibacillus lautus]